MTRSRGLRRTHTKNTTPRDPAVLSYSKWPFVNQNLYVQFRRWLTEGGYGFSSLNTYSVAARLGLGFLNLPYWKIDPKKDLQLVREHIHQGILSPSTQREYLVGLDKLAEFLYFRCQHRKPDPKIHWETYTKGLTEEWTTQVRAYLTLRSRSWPPDQVHRRSLNLLCSLTPPLRWLAANRDLKTILDLTPELWYDYLEYRLEAHISPNTLNRELYGLHAFLYFLNDQGTPVCQRMFRLSMLDETKRFPRDVPVELLRKILAEIEAAKAGKNAYLLRMAVMDYAWVLLMLHCGLRTMEVRRLKFADLDWDNRRIRIEQSKGLKDRFVFLSAPVIAALKAYLEIRGTRESFPEEVFISRHQPLGSRYCQIRLNRYSKKAGVHISPHQLRHCCATLLLNAGAPILTVQAILGHKHIDTTLGYARLYDGTVAADYYRAMIQIESQFCLPEDKQVETPGKGELLAMVDALQNGTLNENQLELVHSLRSGIQALKLPEPQTLAQVELNFA